MTIRGILLEVKILSGERTCEGCRFMNFRPLMATCRILGAIKGEEVQLESEMAPERGLVVKRHEDCLDGERLEEEWAE